MTGMMAEFAQFCLIWASIGAADLLWGSDGAWENALSVKLGVMTVLAVLLTALMP